MIVNKNSWHFKIYSHYTVYRNALEYVNRLTGYTVEQNYKENFEYKRTDNFCVYWRHVLIYPIVSLLINLFLISMILLLAISFPIGVAYLGGAVIGIIVALLGIFSLFYGADIVKDKITDSVNNEDSFIGTLYTTYKNKICTKMEYRNDKK